MILGNLGYWIPSGDQFSVRHSNILIDEVQNYDLSPFKQYITESVVLDLGAHIGCVSKLFYEMGAKKVISVEPNSDLIECLKANIEPYESYIVEGAVTNTRDEVVNLYKHPLDNTSGTVVEKSTSHWRQSVVPWEVTNYNFLDLVDEYNPSVVKMDIEGSEWEILLDPPPKSIDLLLIEWHNNLQHDVRNLPEWVSDYNVLHDYQKRRWCLKSKRRINGARSNVLLSKKN